MEFGALGKWPHQGVYAIHYLSVTPHLVSQIIMEVDYFTTALPQEHVFLLILVLEMTRVIVTSLYVYSLSSPQDVSAVVV